MFVSAVSDRFKEALQVAGGINCNVARSLENWEGSPLHINDSLCTMHFG